MRCSTYGGETSMQNFYQKKSSFLFVRDTTNGFWNIQKLIIAGLNPFSANVPLLYPLETSENLRFSDVFREYRSGTLVENGLIIILIPGCGTLKIYNSRSLNHSWYKVLSEKSFTCSKPTTKKTETWVKYVQS